MRIDFHVVSSLKSSSESMKKVFPSRHFLYAIGFLLSNQNIFKAKFGKSKKYTQQLLKLKAKNILIFFLNENKFSTIKTFFSIIKKSLRSLQAKLKI